jgi:hypothetical protein
MDIQFAHPGGKTLLEEVGNIFKEAKVFERKHRHIVFVCGGSSTPGSNTLRSQFLAYARKNLPTAITVLAEDAYKESGASGLQFIDLGIFEELIAGVSDCVVIFPESVGSYAELGYFAKAKNEILQKLLVVNTHAEHARDSFLNLGPIHSINRKSGLRPTIAIRVENVEADFSLIKERLDRLKLRKNRRRFEHNHYRKLKYEEKMIAVLATVRLLRLVSDIGLEQSIRISFGAASKKELGHITAVLKAAGFLAREEEYLYVRQDSPFPIEFEDINVEDLESRALFYYQKYVRSAHEAVSRIP